MLRALAEDPPALPQPEEGVTYAPKLTKEDGRLDWTQDAAALERQVRALNPWPGTFFDHGGETVRVLAARVEAGARRARHGAGRCRAGRLRRGRAAPAAPAARPAARRMDAEAFLRGFALPRGAALG